MPKETKDLKEKETKKTVVKKTSTKTTTSKKVDTKKTTAVKASAPKTATKKTTTKKATATKKSTTKKKTSTTKEANKKTTVKTKFINEYYDLPYRYNQTIVKILAQTPKKLFVYWDISDEDRNNLQKTFGENFFEKTKPVLVVHNNTLDYSFEVEIDDFANSWYLPINDAKCEYTIELGRRPNPFYYNQANNETTEIPQYIYISSSNNLEAPNNKVLFNPPVYKTVYFRNVKTNQIIAKDILDFPFVSNIQNIGEFYNIYDLYKKFYKDEDLDYMNNPSSGNSSSMNFSSQFK